MMPELFLQTIFDIMRHYVSNFARLRRWGQLLTNERGQR